MFFFDTSFEFYSHQQVRFLFNVWKISVILNIQCQWIDIFSISCKIHLQWMIHKFFNINDELFFSFNGYVPSVNTAFPKLI